MDLFGIGPLEILVIIVIALIVLGPERLVEVSRSLGKTLHSFRKAASDLTTQMNREIEEAKITTTTDARKAGAADPKANPTPEAPGKEAAAPQGKPDGAPR